jgi:hypothetical protein
MGWFYGGFAFTEFAFTSHLGAHRIASQPGMAALNCTLRRAVFFLLLGVLRTELWDFGCSLRGDETAQEKMKRRMEEG